MMDTTFSAHLSPVAFTFDAIDEVDFGNNANEFKLNAARKLYQEPSTFTAVQTSMATMIATIMKPAVLGLRKAVGSVFCCFYSSASTRNNADEESDTQCDHCVEIPTRVASPFEEGLELCNRVDTLLCQALGRELDFLEQLKRLECGEWNPEDEDE